jgi:hypothetical protein
MLEEAFKVRDGNWRMKPGDRLKVKRDNSFHNNLTGRR